MAGEFVNAVDPDGNPVRLPAQNAEAAFADGFRPETPEEAKQREDAAKYGDSEVRAFAEAAGRGLTLGASDWVQTKLGVPAEDLAGRREQNPVASVTGEVAGTVGGMFIPGVGAYSSAGLAAKASTAAARGATALGVGKIATRALTTAAEGAVFGVGSAISEDVLEDGNLDLAGEKLLTHVGLGALLSGGLGGGSAALEHALGKTLRRVGGKAAGAVDDVVDDVAAVADDVAAVGEDAVEAAAARGPGALGETSTGRFRIPDIEDLPDDEAIAGAVKRHSTTIRDVFERLGLEFPTPEKMVLRDLDVTGAQVGKLRAKGVETSAPRSLLDDARYANAKTADQKLALVRTKQQEAAEAIGSSVSRFDELAEAGERLRPLDIANRIDEELIDPLKKSGNVLNDPLVAQLRKQSQRLRKLDQATGGDGLSFKEAEELKRSFDPFLRWDSQTPGPLQDKLKNLRGIVNNEIENAVEAISIRTGSLEPLDTWKAAKRAYGEMAELEKHVAKRAAARDGNRYFSLTDYLSGNMGATIGAGAAGIGALTDGEVGPADLAFAGAGMLGNKWARERLAHVMALQLDKLAKNKTMQTAAKSFALSFKKAEAKATQAEAATAAGAISGGAGAVAAGTTQAPKFLAKYGQALATAATKGANTLFATHMALSQVDPDYGDEMQQAGFLKEDAQTSRAGMAKASKLAAIQEAAQEHDRAMDDAVAGFIKGGGQARIAGRIGAKEFEKRFGELSDLISNPQLLMERLQGGATLAGTAPGVASAVASTASRAIQFLHERAPKNPHAHAMPGMGRKWEPSGAELSKWARYLQAIEDPRSVLDDMRKGSVTREAVEALRAVYPQLATDVQTRLSNAIATNKKPLSYRQRIAVATMMGNELEPTMAPMAVAALQQIHNAAQQQQQRPASTGQRIRVQDSATTSQRLEGK
jgi:hypothetical protein